MQLKPLLQLVVVHGWSGVFVWREECPWDLLVAHVWEPCCRAEEEERGKRIDDVAIYTDHSRLQRGGYVGWNLFWGWFEDGQ